MHNDENIIFGYVGKLWSLTEFVLFEFKQIIFACLQRYDSVMTVVSTQSINEVGKKKRNRGDSESALNNFAANRAVSQLDLSRSLGKNSYFSDVNPRSLKRLMNIVAVTCEFCSIS